jgi:multimeric flavodoxin WrbA
MAEFMSRWVFSEDLSHKVGAAFVTSGGLSAGEELTIVNLLHSMLVFRMVIVGGERWTSAFGASAIVSEGPFQSKPEARSPHERFPSNCYASSPDDVHAMFTDKAEGLGRRVASIASLLVAARTADSSP